MWHTVACGKTGPEDLRRLKNGSAKSCMGMLGWWEGRSREGETMQRTHGWAEVRPGESRGWRTYRVSLWIPKMQQYQTLRNLPQHEFWAGGLPRANPQLPANPSTLIDLTALTPRPSQPALPNVSKEQSWIYEVWNAFWPYFESLREEDIDTPAQGHRLKVQVV